MRLGRYTLATRELPLTLRRVPEGSQLEAWTDSAFGNGLVGDSWGGFSINFPGSGAILHSSSTPRVSDATGAAELFQAVRAAKAIIGSRPQKLL